MGTKPHIVIIGAGIGGLTAAASLLQRGFDVDVYEQAPALMEVGAGVQISANGTRVLCELGLEKQMYDWCWQPEGKEIRLWSSGQTWTLFDLGAESIERYGYPYVMFHRADLHNILADAVRQAKPDAIHLNARCTGFEQDDGGATAHFQDGSSVRADAVIGADGTHSAIRGQLWGADNPKFTGIIAWRGVIPAGDLPEGLFRPAGTNWVGPGAHVIHYYLRRGELMNVVGLVERDDWQVESWSAQGTMDEMANDFRGWHEDVHTLISKLDPPYKWALFLRPPLPQWRQGRVSLLGDACHPMVPLLAQGAVMAIEDGMVLARCVETYSDDVPAALQRYEDLRRDRTAKTVIGSNENAGRFHNQALADPEQAEAYVTREWQPERVTDRYEWLFTYDATSVEI